VWKAPMWPRPTGPIRVSGSRAEDLLRQGYAVSGVRDHDAITKWLQGGP
jgi:hypothetical protein